ncbi:general transcription factor IIH subunit 1 [Planococcus citri]|uniref:general transcription factor IIH subunit 1 n=1 Tax=Planococcus citri TaxID=170843 RepID=UPI0031F9F991
MTTSSEEILLQVSNVKHKKGEGTLYVMSERIAFILQGSETVSVSHPYTDIKVQKISSEFKTKVQLQLVFHDNSASTFQFIKPDRSEAMRDRDKVKDELSKLLPKFQKKMNKELEEKNRILSENPALLQLYRDLVITQVISADEFWSQHAPKYAPRNTNNSQHTGVPGNFLVNIKPQVDGCNSVKYNLNYETINCIFKTYPAVRKKHLEYVPNKMSESEFWKKFFESHYFHKDRINMGSNDIFSECAKFDEQELKKELKTLDNDSLVNLNSMEDVDMDEGYGLSNDDFIKTSNLIHESIIKRFNQHSINVLKASKLYSSSSLNDKTTSSISNSNNETKNGTPKKHDVPNGNSDNSTSAKKMRVLDKINYEDLNPSCSNSSDQEQNNLKLTKVEQFANNLTKCSDTSNKTFKMKAANTIREQVANDVLKWSKQTFISPMNPSVAVQALGELTPGGSLMKGLLDDSQSGQLLPSDVSKELQNLYMALGELLRHFWACFPPTTPTLEEKLIRTHEALRRFHSVKLKPFEDSVLREHSHLNQISSHLTLMLTSAYTKFSSWHCRRKPHPS